MTDRDRLIELIKAAKTKESFDTIFADIDTLIDMPHGEEYLADYLLANGVLVPPCKVGDKVYFIDFCTTAEDFGKHYVSWGEVLKLSLNCFGEWVILTDKRLIVTKEGIFLTEEEAEAKLKELKDNA